MQTLQQLSMFARGQQTTNLTVQPQQTYNDEKAPERRLVRSWRSCWQKRPERDEERKWRNRGRTDAVFGRLTLKTIFLGKPWYHYVILIVMVGALIGIMIYESVHCCITKKVKLLKLDMPLSENCGLLVNI